MVVSEMCWPGESLESLIKWGEGDTQQSESQSSFWCRPSVNFWLVDSLTCCKRSSSLSLSSLSLSSSKNKFLYGCQKYVSQSGQIQKEVSYVGLWHMFALVTLTIANIAVCFYSSLYHIAFTCVRICCSFILERNISINWTMSPKVWIDRTHQAWILFGAQVCSLCLCRGETYKKLKIKSLTKLCKMTCHFIFGIFYKDRLAEFCYIQKIQHTFWIEFHLNTDVRARKQVFQVFRN